MNDYTPTTGAVSIAYEDWMDYLGKPRAQARVEFDRWLAAHDAEVRAESAEAHERTKRGAKTLGEIVVRQVEDMLRWAGMEDQIGTHDPDQQLAWERCAEMPGRIAELEAELAELRAGVVAEEPGHPEARASDYAAGTRWMREDGSVWEVAWDAPAQRWTWVPVKQEPT